MKKSLSFLLVVALTSFLSTFNAAAQGTAALRILSMPFFPDLPSDTAYEGQSYPFDIILFNNTSTPVNSTLEIVLKSDTVETTIYSNPAGSVLPGDTITISFNGYNFDQSKYQAGNNIVVVWPRVSNSPIPIDTFYTEVFFVPLNSLGDGIPNFNDLNISTFPVPSVDYISFAGFENKVFEYVRIYSVTGQLISLEEKPLNNRIFIGNLPAGTYFIEAGLAGRRYYSKFLKQ